MLVIPAIDLKGGNCVRLAQGVRERETLYSSKPAEMARHWEAQGAEIIHVVDLDGAFEGSPRNLGPIKKIIKAVAVPVQVGGGIRSLERIAEYLNLGVARVIIGTAAIRDEALVRKAVERFEGRIAVSVDAREGKVAVKGWTEETTLDPVDLAKTFAALGISTLIYTDIARDGMQTGPNIEATRRVAEAVDISVIAAGGINNINDIRAILKLEGLGVEGVITGRALYEGSLDLREAVRVASNRGF